MKPGPRRSISQTDIVGTAFEILEQKGFAAVSIRGVAAALGLTPTAMYTYFPSKNALLRAMVEQVLAGLVDAEAAERPWRERVHAVASALRDRLAEHAGAILLLTSGPLDGRNAVALGEALIAAFVEAGLGVDDAARAAHAVRALVVGVATLEAARGANLDEASKGPQPLWSDASGHPLTDATAHLALDGGDTAEFGWALDRLLDGLAATADRVAA